MKYTNDQRLYMGRRIYVGAISWFEAAAKYGIGSNTAQEYGTPPVSKTCGEQC